MFKHEDVKDFSDNYKTFIKMNCRDEAGIIRPIDDVIVKWLKEPVQTKPTLMLIGDFGDGKSFFTYCLSRTLAEDFSRSQKGWIPLRLSLREFNIEIIRSSRLLTPQEFLKHRLDQFGADLSGWYEIKKNYNTLIILDGFDEMSTSLDNQTILENTHALINCCKEFEGLKILFTSRKHFYENKRPKDGVR